MSRAAIIFLIPVFLSFYVAYSMELVDFSTDISSKVITYSDDMASATQCVLKGNLLEECSKGLTEVSFSAEIENFNRINNEILNKTSEMLENVNVSLSLE